MTYWGGSGYRDEPVDPNPVAPAAPPGWVAMPPGLPPYGYPAPPAWPGYGSPPDPRPASATGAAVLGFVLAGFLLAEGLLMLVGASVIGSLRQSLDESGGVPASLVVNGALNLAAGAALIAGAATLLHRAARGRALLAAAGVVVLGESMYWSAVGDAGVVPAALLHAAMAVVGSALAYTAATTTWLRAGQPSG